MIFVFIKTCRVKNEDFLTWMKITMTFISKRQCACSYIYKKQNSLGKVYIYIEKARHFAKSKTTSVTFLLTKIPTNYVTQFSWNFEIGIYIFTKTWHFALHVVFIYKNTDTSKKLRQFALRFYIQKAWHFALHNFHVIFEIVSGGRAFYIKK